MTTAGTRPGEGVHATPAAATSVGAGVDDAAILGGRIRQLRKSAGLTLDRVADAAQISASLLSRIERKMLLSAR